MLLCDAVQAGRGHLHTMLPRWPLLLQTAIEGVQDHNNQSVSFKRQSTNHAVRYKIMGLQHPVLRCAITHRQHTLCLGQN